MEINFEIGGHAARFQRDAMTGRTAIVVDDRVITLASPFNPFTHFRLSTHKTWRRQVDGHDVRIIKDRPLLVGGLRENSYVVVVDGQEVATATGM